MNFRYDILVFLHFIWILHFTGVQACTFPATLLGTWTSTNLGTITISQGTPSFSMTKIFTGQTGSGNDFICRYVSGTKYVLQAVSAFAPFSGTGGIYMWMCLDLRRASDYTYYYYLNTAREAGFDNYRLAGLPEGSAITVSDVCTTTLDVAEFNTMVKTGDEAAAVTALWCPNVLLGKFSFTYSDASVASTSSNTSFVTSCGSWNRTHIFTNNSGLSGIDPFYSTEGLVGCIANVHDSGSSVYFTSLYNLDSSPDPEFICVAAEKQSDGSVLLSIKPLDCDSGQSPTVLPTDGALMELSPQCVPPTDSKSQNWAWLALLIPCICLLIVFIVVSVCLHVRMKKREKDHARAKKSLNHDNHPLGEMSMPLDAPPSLDRRSSYIDEDEELLTTRRRTGRGKNIMGEQSLDLNLDYNKWSRLENVNRPDVTHKGSFSSNGVLGKRRLQKASVPAAIETSRSQTYKSHTSRSNVTKSNTSRSNVMNTNTSRSSVANSNTSRPSVIKSNMLEKKLSRTKPNGLLKSHTSLKLGITRGASTSGSRPGSSKKNGIHPAPHKPSSRPSSSRSRRGSIDNLVFDRHRRASAHRRTPRSKTMVLSSNADESIIKSPSDIKPNIFTMPEEYQTDGGPNQLIPERPSLTPNRGIVETYRSLRTFRSNTGARLMKPKASRSYWR